MAGKTAEAGEKPIKNQRRKPYQARAREKYLAILEACTQVLSEFGYKKATIMELSLASGVAIPTIYQYFANKEAIVLAWFDSILDKVLDSAVAMADSLEDGDLEAQIEPMLGQVVTLIAAYRPSVQRVFIDLPTLLSSRLITSTEEKTVRFVKSLKTPGILALDQQQVDRKIALLVRCVIGYLITMVLSEEAPASAGDEAAELSLLVRAYLHASGMLPTAAAGGERRAGSVGRGGGPGRRSDRGRNACDQR